MKIILFIYVNTRFLQTVYQKRSSSSSSRKGHDRIQEEKSLKLKTLRNIHAKLCNIILLVSYI